MYIILIYIYYLYIIIQKLIEISFINILYNIILYFNI